MQVNISSFQILRNHAIFVEKTMNAISSYTTSEGSKVH